MPAEVPAGMFHEMNGLSYPDASSTGNLSLSLQLVPNAMHVSFSKSDAPWMASHNRIMTLPLTRTYDLKI